MFLVSRTTWLADLGPCRELNPRHHDHPWCKKKPFIDPIRQRSTSRSNNNNFWNPPNYVNTAKSVVVDGQRFGHQLSVRPDWLINLIWITYLRLQQYMDYDDMKLTSLDTTSGHCRSIASNERLSVGGDEQITNLAAVNWREFRWCEHVPSRICGSDRTCAQTLRVLHLATA